MKSHVEQMRNFANELDEGIGPMFGKDIARYIEVTERLCAYILDGQVYRLDRDVLKSLAEHVRMSLE